MFSCLDVNRNHPFSFDDDKIRIDNIDRSNIYIYKTEQTSAYLNRNIAIINIIKLIIKTTVIITLICVFVKAEKKNFKKKRIKIKFRFT
jgi:hypothetical protein